MIDEMPEKYVPPGEVDAGTDVEPVLAALEYLLDGQQLSVENQDRLNDIKLRLAKNPDMAEIAAIVSDITGINVAAQRLSSSVIRQLQHRVNNLESEVKEMLKALQSAEQQSQASYQATQKVGTTLERQVQDMEYRMRRGGSREDGNLKSTLQQSVSVIKARLDDYLEQGGQQFAQMSSQMQTLLGKLSGLEQWSDEVQQVLQAGQIQLEEDMLTGIPGRAALESVMVDYCADDSRKPLVLLACDIDALKNVNRAYGREAGDRTLQLVAGILQRRLRTEDFIARYGRDRFVIVFQNSSTVIAEEIAQRLLTAIAEAEFHSHGRPVRLTVSGGIVVMGDSETPELALDRVFAALQNAKNRGGNKLYLAD